MGNIYKKCPKCEAECDIETNFAQNADIKARLEIQDPLFKRKIKSSKIENKTSSSLARKGAIISLLSMSFLILGLLYIIIQGFFNPSNTIKQTQMLLLHRSP